MDKKIKVAVLMGGPSAEYEISLKTGEQVLKNLDKGKYAAKGITISKNGKWTMKPEKIKKDFDVVFIAMHGEFGEDGEVQKILEKHKIKYTGSGSKASALGMDKVKSGKLFQKAGLKVPKFAVSDGVPSFRFEFPIVVKPADRGSSVGVSIVTGLHELAEAMHLAQKYSERVMVQEFIKGRELTCSVLEVNGKLKPLVPTEIIPNFGDFFDYRSKYLPGASREITPPKLPKAMIKKIQDAALKAHKAIGARGYSRTDFILETLNPVNAKRSTLNAPRLYVLEINTLPGLTETSLIPQEAKAVGISFSQLLDRIIQAAL